MNLHFTKPIVVVKDRNNINGYTTIWGNATSVIEELLENVSLTTEQDILNAVAIFNHDNMTSFTIDDFAVIVYSNEVL